MTIDAMREETVPLLREVKGLRGADEPRARPRRHDAGLGHRRSSGRVEKLTGLVEQAASSPLVKIISVAPA